MRFFKELVETLILALLIFLLVQTTLQSFQIQFESMKPNLQPGQRLVVSKAVYFRLNLGGAAKYVPWLHREGNTVFLFHPPQRGEVVVFRPPLSSQNDYIKRVVGLPGETVEIRDRQVFINGQPLREPYILEPPRYSLPLQVIPPLSYFVLGDNRNNSSDSHSWGVVSLKNIVGKAWVSFWPVDRWGLAPNYSFAQAER